MVVTLDVCLKFLEGRAGAGEVMVENPAFAHDQEQQEAAGAGAGAVVVGASTANAAPPPRAATTSARCNKCNAKQQFCVCNVRRDIMPARNLQVVPGKSVVRARGGKKAYPAVAKALPQQHHQQQQQPPSSRNGSSPTPKHVDGNDGRPGMEPKEDAQTARATRASNLASMFGEELDDPAAIAADAAATAATATAAAATPLTPAAAAHDGKLIFSWQTILKLFCTFASPRSSPHNQSSPPK
jgi:hypothetical protein